MLPLLLQAAAVTQAAAQAVASRQVDLEVLCWAATCDSLAALLWLVGCVIATLFLWLYMELASEGWCDSSECVWHCSPVFATTYFAMAPCCSGKDWQAAVAKVGMLCFIDIVCCVAGAEFIGTCGCAVKPSCIGFTCGVMPAVAAACGHLLRCKVLCRGDSVGMLCCLVALTVFQSVRLVGRQLPTQHLASEWTYIAHVTRLTF